MASEARKTIEAVLGGQMTAKVWTGNYNPVLPFTPAGFSVGAVLPMVLYLFRWGHRRGKGKFEETFRSGSAKPTVRSVAERLVADPRFDGFDQGPGRVILSDLLLSAVLENNRRREGHEEHVQRCFASHYLASWIDLPESAAHLRGVPEAIVTIMTDQRKGDVLDLDACNSRYPVGARVQENAFLKAFARGVTTEGQFRTNLSADQFDEAVEIGLDQLLAVRLAQLCGQAPKKASGKGEPGPIPNQWPIARRAATTFREDLLAFFNAYGSAGTLPRHSLLSMLESAVAIGLTTILTATVDIVEGWFRDGRVPSPEDQKPWPIFIDCSMSADPRLRDISEQSSELLRQRLARMPSILMYMRLLDFFVSIESDIAPRCRPPSTPDAMAWLELLGGVASGSHEESSHAERFFRSKCRALAAAIEEDPTVELRGDILADEGGRRYGERLSEVLSLAFDAVSRGDRLNLFLFSALMTDEPNGLARRRRVRLPNALSGGRKTADATSFVLTNPVLEYLVHRHLRRTGDPRKPGSLSLPSFVEILSKRYGFYVDRSPADMEVPNELLQRNRRVLEGRLRDLGLLVGVNDAERMKKLRSRYRSTHEGTNEVAGPAA